MDASEIVTVSIGVAVMEPGRPERHEASVKCVERALAAPREMAVSDRASSDG